MDDRCEPLYPSASWLLGFTLWAGPASTVVLALLATFRHHFLTTVLADIPPLSRAGVAWALVIWAAAVGVFWLGTWLYPSLPRHDAPSPVFSRRLAFYVAGVAVAVWVMVLVYSASIGFGVLGRAVPSVPLPVRLVLARGPLLLGAVVLAATGSLSSGRDRATVVAMAMAPIALTTYVTTSRGSAAIALAPLILAEFCRTTSRPARRVAVYGMAAMAVALVLLYPVISQRRAQLAYGGGKAQSLPVALAQVAMRPQGATGTLYLTAGKLPATPSFDPPSVVSTYTTNVVGVRIPNDFRSPGLVAGLYLAGGPLGLLCGALAFGVGASWVLNGAFHRPLGLYLSCFFVARAIFFLSEGTLQPQDLLALAAGVVLINMTGRVLEDRTAPLVALQRQVRGACPAVPMPRR